MGRGEGGQGRPLSKRAWQGEEATQISQGRALQADRFHKCMSVGRLAGVKFRGEQGGQGRTSQATAKTWAFLCMQQGATGASGQKKA